MISFFDSNVCKSRAHCRTCRSREPVGAGWRRTLTIAFTTPGPDFDCPFGKQWGLPVADLSGYDPDASIDSPKHGSCCDPPRSG